jgi:hypothetical protein
MRANSNRRDEKGPGSGLVAAAKKEKPAEAHALRVHLTPGWVEPVA